MRRLTALFALALGACSGHGTPSTTAGTAPAASAAAPGDSTSLTGDWAVRLTTANGSYGNQMRITGGPGAYGGFMSVRSGPPYRFRSIRQDGSRVIIVFLTPSGNEARLDGQWRGTNMLQGYYSEQEGLSGQFVASRQ